MIKRNISKSELADLYGISMNTLRKWLRSINIDTGRTKILTPATTAQIFEKLGKPEKMELPE